MSDKPSAAQRTAWAIEFTKNGTQPEGYKVVQTKTGGLQFRRIVTPSVEIFDKKIASLKKQIEKQEALKKAFLNGTTVTPEEEQVESEEVVEPVEAPVKTEESQ